MSEYNPRSPAASGRYVLIDIAGFVVTPFGSPMGPPTFATKAAARAYARHEGVNARAVSIAAAYGPPSSSRVDERAHFRANPASPEARSYGAVKGMGAHAPLFEAWYTDEHGRRRSLGYRWSARAARALAKRAHDELVAYAGVYGGIAALRRGSS